MFNFKTKHLSDEVLNHWIASADDFNFSPQEFYARIEKHLEAKKVPGLEISRMEYAEGGLLSANRVYLRLIRERLAFDICAAPFGTRYFFTHRTVYSPAKFGLIQAMVVLMLCAVLIGIFIRLLGFLLGGLAFAAVAVTVGVIFSMAGDKGFPDVDALLLNLPGLGPLYERFFRKETYYRHDTRLMFLDTIPHIVQAEADEITAAKGVKLVREYQTSPILGELYKPVRKGKLVEE